MLKISGKSRLTKPKLEDIWLNSGITELQYEIIRLRYFDSKKYSVIQICDTLSISDGAYKYQLRQAIGQVNTYLTNNPILKRQAKIRLPFLTLFTHFFAHFLHRSLFLFLFRSVILFKRRQGLQI